MSSMQLLFVETQGKTIVVNSPLNPTREEFREMAKKALERDDIDQARYIVSGKQIDIKSDEEFNKKSHLLTNLSSIFIVYRLLGGETLHIEIHWEILLSELDSLLEKSQKKKKSECMICSSEEQCLEICCSYYCDEHIKHNFKNNNGKFKCYGKPDSPSCGQLIDLGKYLEDGHFTASIERFQETLEMMKFINIQICKCGIFMINETLYSQQVCPRCKKQICFFCKKDWENTKMKNNKYYCSDGCIYKNYVTYELVELHYNKAVKIPDRRSCPFCFLLGAYDEKCKYHTCTNPSCKKSFCFICLKEEAVCKREYNSDYKSKCTNIVEQKFTDFPHFN